MIRNASKVVLAGLLLFGAKGVYADELSAMSVCKPLHATDNASTGFVGVENDEPSKAIDVLCTLKRTVVCSTGNCTYTATFAGADGNPTNDSTHNLICEMGIVEKNNAGFAYSSGPVTMAYNSGSMNSGTLSFTVVYPKTGDIVTKCTLGMTGGVGSTYLNWFTTTNF